MEYRTKVFHHHYPPSYIRPHLILLGVVGVVTGTLTIIIIGVQHFSSQTRDDICVVCDEAVTLCVVLSICILLLTLALSSGVFHNYLIQRKNFHTNVDSGD